MNVLNYRVCFNICKRYTFDIPVRMTTYSLSYVTQMCSRADLEGIFSKIFRGSPANAWSKLKFILAKTKFFFFYRHDVMTSQFQGNTRSVAMPNPMPQDRLIWKVQISPGLIWKVQMAHSNAYKSCKYPALSWGDGYCWDWLIDALHLNVPLVSNMFLLKYFALFSFYVRPTSHSVFP